MRKISLAVIGLAAGLGLSACGENVGNDNRSGSGHGDTAGQGAASGRTSSQDTAPATEAMQEPARPSQP